MDLPKVAKYIVQVPLIIPALNEHGVSPLYVCFYFAALSTITSPVALAVYCSLYVCLWGNIVVRR